MLTCLDCRWIDLGSTGECDQCTHPKCNLFPDPRDIEQMRKDGYEYDAEDCPGFEEFGVEQIATALGVALTNAVEEKEAE